MAVSTIELTARADYVIEVGTSGGWRYRKWNSGITEAWILWTGTLTHYWTGNGFYGYSTGVFHYPAGLFVGNPTVTADGVIGNGFYMGTAIMLGDGTVGLAALSTASGTQTCTFSIHAIGRWK